MLKKILAKWSMREVTLTQNRLIIRDVIPIVSRMLYDKTREDHKSSENLKEKEKLARWFAVAARIYVARIISIIYWLQSSFVKIHSIDYLSTNDDFSLFRCVIL